MGRLGEIIAANKDTFQHLVRFSIFMFAAAIGSFFLFSSEAVAGRITDKRDQRDIVGAVAAILVTNVCIGVFAYKALSEPDDRSEQPSIADMNAADSADAVAAPARASSADGGVRRRA